MPPPNPTPKRPAAEKKTTALKHLVFCTFNIRGARNRGVDLKQFILDNEIAFTAVQEPKLSPNDLPEDYDTKTLMLPHIPAGIRGLMWVFHPTWAGKYSRPVTPPNQNIAWIQVDLRPGEIEGIKSLLVANVYLSPLDTDRKEVAATAGQLTEDVTFFLKYSHNAVMVMGDWNYDHYTKKGANKSEWLDILAIGAGAADLVVNVRA